MVTMTRRFCSSIFLTVVLVALSGCAVTTEPPQTSDDALPDFSLADVNANSARYREDISPRDYLGQVSAWYFGHST